ncbi:putative hydrolase or acyltransferase family protein (alpha/beta hydrolase superfamily) [Desulforapulum autotrophicum HRM2]|uniref:Hydrolase or acyltransferase family protein (Alpha/beta hydrolase superfamily) n=1 Tax=Desulforapulum autotrophicum (strain ATCC 43914 / DSM 3382 / VKM B-1955 / HRM2) TaxID=177437 RepID=C0QDX5_DESAH|nr:alpha/beta hydrolase [Desulforapulum autotrophicum]ACN17396.1 putative hydrolase or acyltransferase family protein (alpha/beta hydrolase superfamily) [Desulforapulum autotrophicum HRM2]
MKKYLLILILAFAVISPAFAGDTIKYNKELDGFNYPFEVNTFKFNSQNQDLRMRYMDIGDRDAQKVIVLIHGKNFSGYYWERVAKDLLKRKYRVIMPDQIGFGKSSKPESYQYSFGQLALNTKSLLDNLNIKKFDLVGHSMGGMLATTFAVNYPELVNKLILINPLGLEDYGRYVEFKDINFFYERELAKTLDNARNYQKKNYYDGKWSSEYEKLLIPLDGMLAGEDWKIVAWNNALTYGPIFSENMVDKFSQIQSETFLIIGTRDKTGPGRGWLKKGVTRKLGEYKTLGKNAKNMIKGSILIELDGLGHMPQYENYDVFIKAFYQAIDA